MAEEDPNCLRQPRPGAVVIFAPAGLALLWSGWAPSSGTQRPPLPTSAGHLLQGCTPTWLRTASAFPSSALPWETSLPRGPSSLCCVILQARPFGTSPPACQWAPVAAPFSAEGSVRSRGQGPCGLLCWSAYPLSLRHSKSGLAGVLKCGGTECFPSDLVSEVLVSPCCVFEQVCQCAQPCLWCGVPGKAVRRT